MRNFGFHRLRVDEDERDAEIARVCLEEIENNPEILITGDELQARLAEIWDDLPVTHDRDERASYIAGGYIAVALSSALAGAIIGALVTMAVS